MTQRDYVLQQFRANGYITRNQCLRNFISRLGAIICDLCKEGYDIKGSNMKTETGSDYIYKLIPKQTNLL